MHPTTKVTGSVATAALWSSINPARWAKTAVFALLVGFSARSASAASTSSDDKPKKPSVVAVRPKPNPAPPTPMFGTFEGTYGLGGIATGFSFAPNGYYLGGELSVVRQFQEFAWLGGYVDGVYDFGRDQTRFSVGPEVGWSAFGIDGGYLLALDAAGAHSGVTVRPLLTMGFVSGYARLSHLFGPSSTWLEAGILLKYPIEL